jgi:hypothetical protein
LRLLVTVLALLAFTLQGYVTQTHIHMAGPAAGATFAGLLSSGDGKAAAQRDRYPASQDPANCPICQELLHSGSFITPSAVAILLPSLAVSILAIVIDTAIVPQPVSHSWRGRAPPRH